MTGSAILQKIVSGGQTGVDRAALDVALELGIPCGGWCPEGRQAGDGIIPARYPLQETGTPEYAERTRLNVLDSDGTLILNVAKGSVAGQNTPQMWPEGSESHILSYLLNHLIPRR